mmetsp:Transcript_8518/g.13112  ORF Transcript_8518/g.13112 Transcript_8518/m.13112 type:complete len:280 (-) Transcript_8518:37-876(-)
MLSKRILQVRSRVAVRHFGAAATSTGESLTSKSANTQMPIADENHLNHQIPKNWAWNDKFNAWMNARFPIDRTDVHLQNDKPNKLSAYHQLRTNGLFQNGLLLKLFRTITFSNSSLPTVDPYDQAEHNEHPEALFLYRSPQATDALRWNLADFLPVAVWSVYFLVPGYSAFLVPACVSLATIPRRWVQTNNFVFHAELLADKEQVVFHKLSLFGTTHLHYVDIESLEKAEKSLVTNNLMWSNSTFDKRMVFRCAKTHEKFIFDRNGYWNEDTLKHPLLY